MYSIKLFNIIIQATLVLHLLIFITAQKPQPNSHITIQGSVFCDVCYKNAFTRHSYFLSGVNVQIQCKLKANSAETSEQIAFSVNRTTNKYGIYKLDIKPFEGADCAERPEIIQSFCKASLTTKTSNSSSKCNVPSLRSTTTQLTLKSKQNNLCIYSMSPLSYTPHKKNVSLCGGNNTNLLPNSFNSSKFFLPNFPPFGYGYVFNWPPLPQLPPWPPFIPFPFYFPPYPQSPFPSPPPRTYPRPPSLPYTYPPTPPFPPMPFFPFPPPPSPQTPYNPRDPSTWIPNYPPQPPGYNIGNNPRSWIPYYYPPSPPNIPQNP